MTLEPLIINDHQEGFICNYSMVQPLLIQSISWLKDEKPIDSRFLNTSITEAGRRLNFKSAIISEIHNGFYRCDVKLKNNDLIYESNIHKIQVPVDSIVPRLARQTI